MPDITAHSPDEFLRAFRDQPLSPPIALYAGAALHRAGRIEEAVAVWTIGADHEPMLRKMHLHPQANDELKTHSKLANDAICAHFAKLQAETLDAVEEKVGEPLGRVRAGIWPHFAPTAFDYRATGQRPLTFYMPDLPAAPVTSSDDLPWAAAIEAATGDILAEYQSALASQATFKPYVFAEMAGGQWDELRENPDWSALFIHYNAEVTDMASAFPKTLAALADAPLVRRDGVPLETFFSRLTPGTRIPPHHGLTNSRLTVHLPVIVPTATEENRPWIRVGDAIHHWRVGELFAFDDSFEHEACNPTDADRTVLIFEAHHPDLNQAEIAAIEAVYSAFDDWGTSRATLLGLNANGEAPAT
ncbi:MAG: aspartyl/asparaginyl beta-hydroxylase domain-containing protein [Pseudomonadota bacterium]